MSQTVMFGHGSNPPMVAGLYSPTLTAILNVDTVSLNSTFSSYFRIGDLVFVFTTLYINPTATGLCQVDISLPIEADFSGGAARANGVAGTSQGEAGRVDAKNTVTPHVMSLHFTAVNTTEHAFGVSASYRLN